jgi:hypothetical protein
MSEQRFFQSPQPIIIPEETPLVFLEGPVQGAPDWQTPLAHRLLDRIPNLAVASPRPLEYHLEGLTSDTSELKLEARRKQIAYEILARQHALQFGVIALWWAAQDPAIEYPKGRRYAKTTHVENGEPWGWMSANENYGFVTGFDPAFEAGPDNSKDYILLNHEFMEIPTHNSLEDFEEAIVGAVASADRRPVPASTSRLVRRALDQLRSE